MSRLSTIYKALQELGPKQVGLYGWYQFGLYSGYLRWATNSALHKVEAHPERLQFNPLLEIPGQDDLISVLGEAGMSQLLREADEIVSGEVRLFGAEAVPLKLSFSEPLHPWTAYETKPEYLSQLTGGTADIKHIWEPGRFGWVYTLARAYYLSGNERYPRTFWELSGKFFKSNPPYSGPFWVSAQEVALRLMALVFALQVFWGALESTPERVGRLKEAICEHAARIPATISYARAQNNNHLLSEAAGLLTAGSALPNHPQSEKWRTLGWCLINEGFEGQIADDGTYMQHSSNYHRLMLQIALWVNAISKVSFHVDDNANSSNGLSLTSRAKLRSAVRWLYTVLDPENGRVPNLGPNDGAYILPLTVCPFEDFRPVTQAAACSFLGEAPLSPGPWDEMNLWIGDADLTSPSTERDLPIISIPSSLSPYVLNIPTRDSWGYMRVAHFNDRPGHADQLHVDLWWRGYNIAQDAGTYLYNADQPWDNALSHTDVHNTVTINNCDQMNRVGRFLYLDWAQSHLLEHERDENGTWERVTAQHVGYNWLGITHRRSITAANVGQWIVEDTLISSDQNLVNKHAPYTVCLQWLLPDWPWEIEVAGLTRSSFSPVDEFESSDDHPPADHLPVKLTLQSLKGLLSLTISSNHNGKINGTQIVRAGELIFGDGMASPNWGWTSPTYGQKVPSVSVRVSITASELPVTLTSHWNLPEPES